MDYDVELIENETFEFAEEFLTDDEKDANYVEDGVFIGPVSFKEQCKQRWAKDQCVVDTKTFSPEDWCEIFVNAQIAAASVNHNVRSIETSFSSSVSNSLPSHTVPTLTKRPILDQLSPVASLPTYRNTASQRSLLCQLSPPECSLFKDPPSQRSLLCQRSSPESSSLKNPPSQLSLLCQLSPPESSLLRDPSSRLTTFSPSPKNHSNLNKLLNCLSPQVSTFKDSRSAPLCGPEIEREPCNDEKLLLDFSPLVDTNLHGKQQTLRSPSSESASFKDGSALHDLFCDSEFDGASSRRETFTRSPLDNESPRRQTFVWNSVEAESPRRETYVLMDNSLLAQSESNKEDRRSAVSDTSSYYTAKSTVSSPVSGCVSENESCDSILLDLNTPVNSRLEQDLPITPPTVQAKRRSFLPTPQQESSVSRIGSARRSLSCDTSSRRPPLPPLELEDEPLRPAISANNIPQSKLRLPKSVAAGAKVDRPPLSNISVNRFGHPPSKLMPPSAMQRGHKAGQSSSFLPRFKSNFGKAN